MQQQLEVLQNGVRNDDTKSQKKDERTELRNETRYYYRDDVQFFKTSSRSMQARRMQCSVRVDHSINA